LLDVSLNKKDSIYDEDLNDYLLYNLYDTVENNKKMNGTFTNYDENLEKFKYIYKKIPKSTKDISYYKFPEFDKTNIRHSEISDEVRGSGDRLEMILNLPTLGIGGVSVANTLNSDNIRLVKNFYSNLNIISQDDPYNEDIHEKYDQNIKQTEKYKFKNLINF
jgi:hypothetical protein